MRSIKEYIKESLLDDEEDLVDRKIGKIFYLYKHSFSKFQYIDVYNRKWEDIISLNKLDSICDEFQYKIENDKYSESIYPSGVKDKYIRYDIINFFINLSIDRLNRVYINKEFNNISKNGYHVDFFKTNNFLTIIIYEKEDIPLIEIGFEKRKIYELQ